MKDILKNWLMKLGLITEDADPDDAAIEALLPDALAKADAATTDLEAARTRIADLEATVAGHEDSMATLATDKAAADAAVTATNAVADGLRTKLVERTALLAIATGKATAAQKPAIITALNADLEGESERLLARSSQLPVSQPLNLGPAKKTVTTLTAATTAINAWCDDQGGTRAEAWQKSKTVPELKEHWQAINDADKKRSAPDA